MVVRFGTVCTSYNFHSETGLLRSCCLLNSCDWISTFVGGMNALLSGWLPYFNTNYIDKRNGPRFLLTSKTGRNEKYLHISWSNFRTVFEMEGPRFRHVGTDAMYVLSLGISVGQNQSGMTEWLCRIQHSCWIISFIQSNLCVKLPQSDLKNIILSTLVTTV